MRLFESASNARTLMSGAIVLLTWLFVCITWITISRDARISLNVCHAPATICGQRFAHIAENPSQAMTFITSISSTYSVPMQP